MKFRLPNDINLIISKLQDHGFEAWCVGGAVRDMLLNKTPIDFDITTNASPENVIALFEKTIPTGIKHGTVTVITEKHNVEITTYRHDGLYLNNRSPKQVSYISSVEEDVKRRDFTMNAVLYNELVGFLDLENGITDIKNKTIRAVGDPYKRFKEDALRIMRCFRFASELNFNIEENTRKAALESTKFLDNISIERVFSEFKRIILSDYPQNADEFIFKTSLLFNDGTLNENFSLNTINILPKNFALRIALLSKNFGFNCIDFLRKLKSDNTTINSANCYLKILNSIPLKDKSDIKYVLKECDRHYFEDMINGDYKLFSNYNSLIKHYNEIIKNDEPYSLKQLSVNGDDLQKLGISGTMVGKTLKRLLDIVIKSPNLNKKEILLNFLK